MPPDPAQPLIDLPSQMGSDLASLVSAIAPWCYALLIAGVVATVAVVLVRKTLP